MNFTQTYSRADLQQQQAKYKRQLIMDMIGNEPMMSTSLTFAILQAARQGKTQYIWEKPKNTGGGVQSWPPPPVITDADIIEVLKEKFPDTTVEYKEIWIETRPGVKEQKKGIMIDWS